MSRATRKKISPKTASAPTRPRIPRVLLLVETTGSFGRDAIRGIGHYALEHGPWSIQYEYRSLESLPPLWLNQWKGDGIISRTVTQKQKKILQETNLPLVELHGDPRFGIAHVTIDAPLLSHMAFEHLRNCGLRHFGFFTIGDAPWIRLHRGAFSEILQENGYGCHVYSPSTSHRNVPVWHENLRPSMIRWLSSLPRPIGLYTLSDVHSVRLLDMCHELDVAVPEEIAVLGLGNDSVICETVRPTLSSIDLNARRIGYEAAALLDRMMAGIPFENIISIPPSHVEIRQSTDLIAIEDADVAQALRLIRETACAGIDVDRVAEAVGLSRSALHRRFLRLLKRTPKHEIMRIRLERAKVLLMNTEKITENTARKCGFSSLKYFNMAFRRELGMTPSAYRKMRRISRDQDKM
jgi:LacI family transcriptional regulator